MDYYEQKAKIAYEKFQRGEPFKKVYAVVQKGDKFVVLKHNKGRYEFSLSGGGVEDGESNVDAVKREVLEELNIKVEVKESLGFCRYVRTWRYQGKEFDVDHVAEIFLTEFVSFGENKKFGIEGEFDGKEMSIAEISREEMLEKVFEFKNGGIKFE